MSAKDQSEHYYIPDPSPWPIIGMISLLITLFGGALAINGVGTGNYIVMAGLLLFAVLLYGWFRDVVDENLSDRYNRQVDRSFRMGMFWFIASEVFFFLAFFGSLFYIRTIALPWLGGEGYLGVTREILYGEFQAVWPSSGPGEMGGGIQTHGTLGNTGHQHPAPALQWSHHHLGALGTQDRQPEATDPRIDRDDSPRTPVCRHAGL